MKLFGGATMYSPPSPIALQSQTMSMIPGYFHWKQLKLGPKDL